MHPHDFAHYFTIAMLILIPSAIGGGLLCLLWHAWQFHANRSTKRRVKKLRRHFRRSYAAWKKAERANDGDFYIHRDNADLMHATLTGLGA